MENVSLFSEAPESVAEDDRLIGPAGLDYTVGELRVSPISTPLTILPNRVFTGQTVHDPSSASCTT